MNKHQLASTIWESANQMRSKIEANEYKDFILGFIFYKYLSERELDLFQKEKLSEDEIKKVDEKDVKYAKHVRETLGYFIAYDNLFSTWLAKGNDFDVKDVRDALSDFDQNIDEVLQYSSDWFVEVGRDLRLADKGGEEAPEADQEDSDGWQAGLRCSWLHL